MSRIAPVVSSNADSKVAITLSQVEKSLGMVPNLFATLANAPVALDGLLSLSKTLSRGRLTLVNARSLLWPWVRRMSAGTAFRRIRLRQEVSV
jgi:hypothetical protein